MTAVQPIDPSKQLPVELTDQEELFCLEYVANGGNATRAYLRVKPTTKYGAARTGASYWMARPSIQARIAEIRAGLAHEAEVALVDLAKKLKAIAFTDLRDVAEFDGVKLTLKPFDELTPDAIYALDEVSTEPSEWGRKLKFKLQDRRAALRDLAELFGFIKKEIKVGVEGEVRHVMALPQAQPTAEEWRQQYAPKLPARVQQAAPAEDE